MLEQPEHPPTVLGPALRVVMRSIAMVAALCACAAVPISAQSNTGELRLSLTDTSGHGVKTSVRISSDANQYQATLQTDDQGNLSVHPLPFGNYRIMVALVGFAPLADSIIIQSSLPRTYRFQLQVASVAQSVTVNAASTLIDTDQAGAVSHVGSEVIQSRLASIPGRSLEDLVNSQPGWLYEGNAVLHSRGSENQTQFVLDGIPLTDNRSPSLGPEIEADEVQSLSIYTAGIPAEYGRKLGGVVELNTQTETPPGLHGTVALSGGSFRTAGAFARGEYGWGRNAVSGTADGSFTDRFLNPVVPQNYSNAGTLGDFSARYQRSLTESDRLAFTIRHGLSRYDIPNEQVQQAAGQRQTADNLETLGIASYQHIFSADALADVRGMVRDNATDFTSNAASTPIAITQHNSFREGYVKGTVTASHGRQEWKLGFETDNVFLQENLSYNITDPTQFGDGSAPAFAFADQRPDLEQSVFVQDRIRLGRWTLDAGLRWDHYQLLLNRQSLGPRLAVSRYFPTADLVLHFSYDRVFETPSSQNILLSSLAPVSALNPSSALRLPVQPSVGDYYEGGLTKGFYGKLSASVTYFRRVVDNYADDNQIENTSIGFPIAFSKAILYGAEAKINVPDWRGFSGFLSYSYIVGNAYFPVVGGLFLGDDVTAAQTQVSGHIPDSQDQRNTVRGRVRYQVAPRLWLATGIQYDSGLPFEFNGDSATVLAQYGDAVLDRINFARGRIYPTFQLNAYAGLDVYKSDRLKVMLQADGQNLSNVLDVIDFGGLFSGNAIGPARSFALRLTTYF
jgi:TonB-dependent Receptor Plug Domain